MEKIAIAIQNGNDPRVTEPGPEYASDVVPVLEPEGQRVLEKCL